LRHYRSPTFPHFRPLFPTLQALCVLVMAGCALGTGDEAAKPVLVDEQSGLLRGVRFGDTAEKVRAHLGEETDDRDGVFPAGAEFTGPPQISIPRADGSPPTQPEELHYESTSYLVSPTAGVFAMVTLAEGARTSAGVAIGDSLHRVRDVYDRVDCGKAVGSEDDFGRPTGYPWCRVNGDIRLFFGEDPIASITLIPNAARG
jgi:hypothetical protein